MLHRFSISFSFLTLRPPPTSTLFPYTTLFRSVFAESGQLSWMSMAIQMQTSTTAGGQQGGFLGALGRAVRSEERRVGKETTAGGSGQLTIKDKLPGQILPMHDKQSCSYMVTRHG